eukprot:TRINITY_DN94443_c0_g1_i1.p1 TRINITY_DN94443_c0_g1~~TRINITY_DN94443_c0_g1_i1.p1  ORF type:complete len:375 (+),score=79.84 TRINITY_DN94443_c0_g1_i1:64-1188(+)
MSKKEKDKNEKTEKPEKSEKAEKTEKKDRTGFANPNIANPNVDWDSLRPVTIRSPNGQADVNGTYRLAEKLIGNGMPVWKHEKRDLVLFSSKGGKWYVFEGDAVIRSKFQERAFVLSSSEEHHGTLPYDMTCTWRLTKKNTWKLDPDVKVERYVEPLRIPANLRFGDVIYYTGSPQDLPSGQELYFGQQGFVEGRSKVEGQGDKRIEIFFEGIDMIVDIVLDQTSRNPPTLPHGYSLGDTVYYCGGDNTLPDGSRLAFGLRGEVIGKARTDTEHGGERIRVHFQGHALESIVYITSISKYYPVLPSPLKIGGRVMLLADTLSEKFADGDRLVPGCRGAVVGRSVQGDGYDDQRVAVKFEGNKDPTLVYTETLKV